MQRFLFMFLIIAVLLEGAFLIHQHRTAAVQISGCTDIPAAPDYLSTGREQDAIAAINSARQLEHLQPLRLPAQFYQITTGQQQFTLLNLERTDRGLRPLEMDATLSQMAYAYSKQMLDLHFFSHTSPIGGTFSERVNTNPALANHYNQAAENLAGNPVPGAGAIYEYMYDDSVEACGHRKNILDPQLTLVGIGEVTGGEYGSISAQEFIDSAAWNPYVPSIPDRVAPRITIRVTQAHDSSLLHCSAQAEDTAGVTRITWFLDSLNNPPQVGPVWTLDPSHLTRGRHTLLAFAVDGEQNYAMAQYTIRV